MKNSKQPAYPYTIVTKRNEYGAPFESITEPGLTKRELIAAMALQGMLANSNQDITDLSHEEIAMCSVYISDALLSELDKPTNK